MKFGVRKLTRILGLSGSEEIMTLAVFVLTQYRFVIGGHTDGWTNVNAL